MAERTKPKVLIAASEFEPFTSIGHLGRVVSNLSAALSKRIDVRVVIPKYASIPKKYSDGAKQVCEFEATLGRRTYPCKVYQTQFRGVTLYLVSAGSYFDRDQVYSSVVDDIERYSCFCNAVLGMLVRIDFAPDVIQCHDWQLSYIPILHRTNRSRRASDRDFRTLFVIHSMQYQGICTRYDMLDLLDLSSEFFTPATLEFYGQANSLKGGLLFSDRLLTVSASYAREIQHAYYGENLEGIIRSRSADVTGILCGIDTSIFNPKTDDTIHMKYDAATVLANKPKNKRYLQKLLGFEQNPEIPLLIIISDILDYDKGMDLIKFVFDDIMALGVQVILACKGKTDYHEFFTAKAVQYPGRVSYSRYRGDMAQEAGLAGCDLENGNGNVTETMLICGSDALLRPSRIEPCGEKHLLALKYGTLPIVRETGGLKEVVVSLNDDTGEGNGFSFFNYNAHDMLYTIQRALTVYKNDRATWNRLIGAAMRLDFTWDGTAEKYLDVYEALM
ncbi:MAG: glycogen synthase [Clostridiales bacterium]|jgi:starch synthase|nr:glycogen synthase [Clostridiales bacterium]